MTATLKKFAYVTDEGTAIPEACLCSDHLTEEYKNLAIRQAISEGDANIDRGLVDASGNGVIKCIVCGYR